MGLFKEFYNYITRSPSNSGRSRKESSGKKKKKQNKGSRGAGNTNRGSSSSNNNRSGGGSNGSNRGTSGKRNTSSNRGSSSNRSSKSNTTSRTGAFRPVGKAGVMGGQTSTTKKKSGPKIVVGGKTLGGPATKGGPIKRSTGGTNRNAPAYKVTNFVTKGTDKKDVQKAFNRAQNTNANGTTKKTYTHKVDDKITSTVRHTNPRFHLKGGPVKETVKKQTYKPQYYDPKDFPLSTTAIMEDQKAKAQAKKDFKNTENATKYAKEHGYSIPKGKKAMWSNPDAKGPERNELILVDAKDYSSEKTTAKKYVAQSQSERSKRRARSQAEGEKRNTGTVKAEDLTMEEYNRVQNAIRLGPQYANKALGKDLAKKVGSLTAYSADKNKIARVTHNFMNGAVPIEINNGVGIYNKADRLALKHSKESTEGQIGYMAGFMAQFIGSGAGSAGQVIGKSAIKGAAKLAGKEAGKEFAGSVAKQKAKQFAANRLGETIAETPINVADAVKMSTDENGKIDKRALGRYLALNAGMTAVGGAAPDLIGGAWTKGQTKKFISLQQKKATGHITAEESQELTKLTAKLRDKAKAENTLSGISARSSLKGSSLENASENRIARNLRKSVTRELKAQGASDDVIKAVVDQRTKAALKSGQVQDYIASISKSKAKTGVTPSAFQALSRSEVKDYARLMEKQRIGSISKEEAKQLGAFDARLKEARAITEGTLKTVVSDAKKIKGKVSVEDINRLSHAEDYFSSAGMKAEAKEAKQALNHVVKVAKKQNDDVVKAVAIMTKKTGIQYRLASGEEIAKLTNGKASKDDLINGFVHTNPETGRLEVVVNRESPQAIQTILGHETAHVIKDSSEAEFKELSKSLREYAESLGEYKDLAESMKKNYPELDEAGVDEEITSELLGRYIFGENNDFINRLDPSIARKIIEYVKEFIGKVDNPEISAELKKMSDEVEKLIGKIDAEKTSGYNKATEVVKNGRRVADETPGGRIASEGRSQGHIFGGDNAHSIGRKRNENDGVAYSKSKRVSKENDTKGNANKPWDVSRIVDKNGKVTKEADDAYARAVESGDMKTAQECVDNLAKVRFPDTVVKYKNGNLKRQFHGTDNGEFYVFRTHTEAGAHFGTKAVAKQKGERIYEVYLDLKNPVVFDKDLGSWDAGHRLTDELFYMKILSPEEYNSLLRVNTNINLQKILKQKGYDGIEYPNRYEGPGESTSYIVFDPNQIKSAEPVTRTKEGIIPLSQRFDKSKRDYRFSKTKKPADAGSFDGETIIASANKEGLTDVKSRLDSIEKEYYKGDLSDGSKEYLLKSLKDNAPDFELREFSYPEGYTKESWQKAYDEAFEKDMDAAMTASPEELIFNPYFEIPRKYRDAIPERTEGWITASEVKTLDDAQIDDAFSKLRELIDEREAKILERELYEGSLNKTVVRTKDYDINVKENGARYSDSRISSVIKENQYGDGKSSAYVTSINPKDYVDLTLSRDMKAKWEMSGEVKGLDEAKLAAEDQAPYLTVDFNTGEIIGHEGRHRMLALANSGIESAPVVIRRAASENDLVTAVRENMELTGQDFGKGATNGARVEVDNLIPACKDFEADIKAAYGGDAKIKFSKTKKPSEPTPLKSIDGMSEAELQKHIYSEKDFHLKRAIDKHGSESPRVKEIEEHIAYAEKRLDEMRKETKAKEGPVEAKEKPAEKPAETPENKELDEWERLLEADKSKKRDPNQKTRPKGEPTKKEETPKSEEKPEGQVRDDSWWQSVRDDPNDPFNNGMLKDTPKDATPDKPEGFGGTKTKDGEVSPKFKEWFTDKFMTFRRKTESSLVGFEHAAGKTKDKGLRAQTTHTFLAKNQASSWIEGERAGFDRKIKGEGLNAIFEKRGLFGKKGKEKKADFSNYLLYKHAIDRLKQDKPVHMSRDGGSMYTREDYEGFIKELESKYSKEELEGFAKDVTAYFDDLMQYRVDAGLVPAEAVKKWKNRYPNYVPTRREGWDEVEWNVIGEDYAANIGSSVKSAVGGSSPIEDLYQQMAKITKETIHKAEENALMNAYAKALGFEPDKIPKEASLDDMAASAITAVEQGSGGWRVNFWHEGEPVTMAVNKQIALGLREFNGETHKRLVSTFSKLNGLGTAYKRLITDWNLMFGVRNGARDIQQAAVNSKDSKYFASNIPSAWAAIARPKNNPYMRLYKANGGMYSALVMQGKKIREPGSKNLVSKGVDNSIGHAIKAIEAANGAIEIAPRLAEFIGTINKYADKELKGRGSSVKKLREEVAGDMFPEKKLADLTADELEKVEDNLANKLIDIVGKDVIDEAMHNSADITLNFSRAGVIGKALNSGLVPYLNPSIQGLSKTIRLFSEGKTDDGWKAIGNLAMKIGTLTIAPAALNEFLLADNRDYQNLNTRDKDTNFFIPIGDGKFIKIPKPRENAVMAEPVGYGLRYFFDKAHVGEIESGEYSKWKDLGQMFQSGVDNIGPVNPLSDNIFSPLWHTAMNKTWYGGSIEDTSDVLALANKEKKHSEIRDENTSAWAKWMADQKIGGKKLSDIAHLSPKKIDNLMDSYLGILYDLGISQTADAKTGNPFVNQFVKDSVFSNKNGTELWAEFENTMNPTTGDKVKHWAKKAVLGNTKWTIQDKSIEAKDWLNQKGYDDITYSDARNKILYDKDLTDAQKKAYDRKIKMWQNDMRHELVYGTKEVTPEMDPIRKISSIFGVDKAMTDFTYTYVDKETGEKKNQHLDAWNIYKKSGSYKKDSEKASQKFIELYSEMRWTNGRIGESKSFPGWMTASILAATSKGNNDDFAKAYIRPKGDDGSGLDKDYQEKIIQRGKNYRDAPGKASTFRLSQKDVFLAGRDLGYEHTNDMQPWDKSMAIASSPKKYADTQYYAADTSGGVSRRMPAARFLNKTGHTTEEINKFAKKYDLVIESKSGWKHEDYEAYNSKVKAAVEKEYGKASNKEKAAAYYIITDDWYGENPFGDFGDQRQKNDTGVTDLDKKERYGRGGRRRRGRRGRRGWGRRGGGSGGSGGGEMPEIGVGSFKANVSKPGAIKKATTNSKATTTSKGTANAKATVSAGGTSAKGKASNVTKRSNLNDAYRKRARKLREATRKNLA